VPRDAGRSRFWRERHGLTHAQHTHTHCVLCLAKLAARSPALMTLYSTILNYTTPIPYHAILYYIVLRSTRYCTILYFTTLSRADFLSGSQASRNKVVEGMLEQDNIDPNLIRMLSGSILESLLSALFSSQ